MHTVSEGDNPPKNSVVVQLAMDRQTERQRDRDRRLSPDVHHLCALMTYSLPSRRIDALMFVASDEATYTQTNKQTSTDPQNFADD